MKTASRLLVSGLALSLACALAAGCGVKINGKTYGSTGAGTVGTASGTPGTSGTAGTPGTGQNAPSHYNDDSYHFDPDAKIEPYPTAPVDPFAAVDGDQPRRLSEDEASSLKVRDREHDCSAVHDHCLLRNTWFIESEGRRASSPTTRVVVAAVFGPEGPGQPWNVRAQTPDTNGGYTAYRTVPATRKLLAKGALVAALTFPTTSPRTGGDAYGHLWSFGVVDRVDWDAGRLYIVARTEPYLISTARVAVLSWVPGGKVALVGKRTRAQIVVAAGDVIAPAADRGRVSDPWAAVGKDKQPRTVDDADPILTDALHACDAAHDHCLRPWVWFVESGGDAVPGRWNGKAFSRATDLEHAIDNPGMAYRTVPASASNLKAGATVVVYTHSSTISHERDAVGDTWRLGKVAEVQWDAGLLKLQGDSKHTGLGLVRVAVVQWFPGEQAEALP